MHTLAPTDMPEVSTSHLVKMAIAGLEPMYDRRNNLFCHRLKRSSSGMVMEGVSYRYTIMTLLGLLRARSARLEIFIDIEATIGRLLKETTWVDNLGDLGILLWLCSTSEEHQRRFYTSFKLGKALEQYPDARRRMTMELSWFLTGLSQANVTGMSAEVEGLAEKTYRLICGNQGDSGLFGHMSRWNSSAGIVRGNIGSFADQVYPTVALAHFSRSFGVAEAYDRAFRCAEMICKLQGPLGQWWWHYEANAGRVVECYPVYSVHQHGMGPMALLALGGASQGRFESHIRQGLNWVNGHNELQLDLEDRTTNVIWRCIRPEGSKSYADYIHGFLGRSTANKPLNVSFECRPYELGWLLYALTERPTVSNLF
ncbi:MAG TPA: hypothetical protein VGS27_13255 [Candidatus Sulfotelmatobacter sp.]|nr:hypothetical protein [Candidatus Sulfotelmatobacter sp.]